MCWYLTGKREFSDNDDSDEEDYDDEIADEDYNVPTTSSKNTYISVMKRGSHGNSKSKISILEIIFHPSVTRPL